MRDPRQSAGLFARPDRAVLELAGPDVADYLHRMLTCSVKDMQPGIVRQTSLLKGDGRMVALGTLVRVESTSFFLLTSASRREALVSHLDRYLITEDVQVSDRSGDFAVLELFGSLVPAGIVGSLTGGAELEAGRAVSVQWQGQSLILVRTDELNAPTFKLVVPSAAAEAFRAEVLARVRQAGGEAVGEELWEDLRVAAGVPAFGAELDETTIPLEAGLHKTISFTKGCFPGQEIVARIENLGHPANVLVGLRFTSERGAEAGTPLYCGEKPAGRITSIARSPATGEPIALGYVKWDQREAGTRLAVGGADSKVHAVVTTLPFV